MRRKIHVAGAINKWLIFLLKKTIHTNNIVKFPMKKDHPFCTPIAITK